VETASGSYNPLLMLPFHTPTIIIFYSSSVFGRSLSIFGYSSVPCLRPIFFVSLSNDLPPDDLQPMRLRYERRSKPNLPKAVCDGDSFGGVADVQTPLEWRFSDRGLALTTRPSSPRPMAPAHSTHPRVQQHQQHQQHQQRDQSANSDIVEHGLFLEPMMGIPLAMYVHKDVPDHGRVVDLITVSPSAARSTPIPPSRVFAVVFKITTAVSGCAMFSLDVYYLAPSTVSHSGLPEKRRHSRQLLQWRHLYLRYEKIYPTYLTNDHSFHYHAL
jgi:hypothetical protein